MDDVFKIQTLHQIYCCCSKRFSPQYFEHVIPDVNFLRQSELATHESAAL